MNNNVILWSTTLFLGIFLFFILLFHWTQPLIICDVVSPHREKLYRPDQEPEFYAIDPKKLFAYSGIFTITLFIIIVITYHSVQMKPTIRN